MSTGSGLRILVLVTTAIAVLVGEYLSSGKPVDPRVGLSWPCRLGPYLCQEVKDRGIDDAIRLKDGVYLWRMYRTPSEEVEFYAVSAREFSFKDPSTCLRPQGWTVMREEPRLVQTATGIVPAREYVLASPGGQPLQIRPGGPAVRTLAAIGLWRWKEAVFTNSYFRMRLYGLIDGVSSPDLVSIQITAGLDKPYADADVAGTFSLLRRFISYWPADYRK